MDNEKIITFQLRLTRRKAWLLLTAFFLCWRPGFLGSETLILTTYYPAPYGGYASLLTTGRTLLARDGDNVGVGLSNPLNKLQVQGVGGTTVDLRVNGRIQTGNAVGAGGVWLSQSNDMFVGQNGANVGFWTAGGGGNWRFNVNQTGAISTGASLPLAGDVAGDIRVGGTVWGLCTPRTYGLGWANACQGNERVISWYGDGNAISGMMFLGGVLENPTRWTPYVSVGADRGGTMLCCKIQ